MTFVVGNTRVISQTALDHFRTSLSARKDDPYSVLLRRNKLPMALLDDATNPNLQKVGLTDNSMSLSDLTTNSSVPISLKPNHFLKLLVLNLKGKRLE